MTQSQTLSKSGLQAHESTLNNLMAMISREDFPTGKRLPSERDLSSMLGVSRNTVRSALSFLQARGIVEIRKGSGAYLISKPEHGDQYGTISQSVSMTWSDRLEACYLIIPAIASLATIRIDNDSLLKVEQCAIRMGRAILNADENNLGIELSNFSRTIALCSRNQALINACKHICPEQNFIKDIFFDLPLQKRETIFSDCIKVLNALKSKKPAEAMHMAQQRILRMALVLSEYRKVKITSYLRGEIMKKGVTL